MTDWQLQLIVADLLNLDKCDPVCTEEDLWFNSCMLLNASVHSLGCMHSVNTLLMLHGIACCWRHMLHSISVSYLQLLDCDSTSFANMQVLVWPSRHCCERHYQASTHGAAINRICGSTAQ